MKYDPALIQTYSEKLYRRAIVAIVFWPLLGIIIGAYVGSRFDSGFPVMIGAIVGAILGYLLGSLLALKHRMQAQTALCLKQIEENTRGSQATDG